jgi:acetyl-CoA synthetase
MTQTTHWKVAPGYRVFPEFLNLYEETVERQIRDGFGNRVAVITNETKTTFTELDEIVSRVASSLVSTGLVSGDRILLLSRNRLEAISTVLAAFKIGVVPVIANSGLPLPDVEYMVANSGARVIFTMKERIGSLLGLREAGKVERLVSLDDRCAAADVCFADFVAQGSFPFATIQSRATDPAFMVYSSGTTGKPKGIVHGHKWVVAVGDPSILQMEFGPGDVICTFGEFCFMGNFGHAFIFPLYAGSAIALYDGKVTPDAVLGFFATAKPNILLSVPTFYRTMLAANDAARGIRDFSFRFMISTGEPLGESVWERWRQETGVTIYEIYGVSEYQTILSNGPALPVKPGSIGKPAPGVDVALIDESLNIVQPGQPGIFAIRRTDPGLFLEYYRQPERWRAQHRGGWYFTGDVMQVDEDGYYYYLGREDDLFKSRGCLISPAEVENVLQRHPAVAEVAVIPRADTRIGNSIIAFVVLKPAIEGNESLAGSLLNVARENLVAYKVPQSIEFVAALPKSAVGKLLRRQIRDGEVRK